MSVHGNPSMDPPGTCRWRNPRDSGPWIKVAANRWVHVGGGGGQDDKAVAGWPVGVLRVPGPVDLENRFRQSADTCWQHGLEMAGRLFDDLTDLARALPIGAVGGLSDLANELPAETLELIDRELTGEEGR